MAMSSDCEIRRCLVWTPPEPDTSTQFFLKNRLCHLTFSSSYYSNSDSFVFSVRVVAADREDESNYSTLVSLEHGDVTGLTASGVFGHSHPSPQTIWQFTDEDIVEAFPDYFKSSEPYKFVLSFSSTTPGEDGKAVEPTLSRAQGKKSLNQVSCLESLSADFSKLLNDGHHPDVELRCGDHTTPAHRAILSARSEVFEAMLQADMLEKRTGSIDIVDVEPSVLREFLRYLYTGTLPELTEDTAWQLYEAGDKYSVGCLKEKCADFLAENLSQGNACDLLTLANAHSDANFKERVIRYILDNEIPLKSDHWQEFSDSHPKLAIEVLYQAYTANKRQGVSKPKKAANP